MRTFLGLIALLCFLSMNAVAGNYFGVYSGANFDDVIAVPFVESKTGYVVGGVVGMDILSVPGLRVEADMSFRQNEVDLFGGKLTVDHDTFALLANLVYDVPVDMGPIHPYVLVGAGYGHTEATFENVALLKLESSGLAWQLGAGLQTELTNGVHAGVGYRYFNGPELDVLGTNLSDGTNHSVLAKLRFDL